MNYYPQGQHYFREGRKQLGIPLVLLVPVDLAVPVDLHHPGEKITFNFLTKSLLGDIKNNKTFLHYQNICITKREPCRCYILVGKKGTDIFCLKSNKI